MRDFFLSSGFDNSRQKFDKRDNNFSTSFRQLLLVQRSVLVKLSSSTNSRVEDLDNLFISVRLVTRSSKIHPEDDMVALKQAIGRGRRSEEAKLSPGLDNTRQEPLKSRSRAVADVT